ncbi:probable inactive receptor kinase At2g26730 [Phragmites australis]|uniref:probable inactive receptor kinase At2g26730 n=1 Tax=Phragmites australis TaxID=29695 RepID=UPI002D76B231|nr:probable inactive receptor kinase At2g26730 [Phragmites australis]
MGVPRVYVTAVLLALAAVAALGPRCASAEPPQRERSALQAFLAGTPHERALGWNASVPACTWVGVTCDKANGTVVDLRLPGVGLIGRLPPGTLGQLQGLQVISLRSNRLFGDIPGDLFSLPQLRSLYLQGNLLSGAIPAEVGRLSVLEHLALSHNNLSGAVPFALNNLTKLRSLRLDGNRLSGNLPSISIRRLEVFNVSYNDLNGSIPSSLARFPPESFAGNLHLCGKPLLDRPCQPFFPSPAPSPGGGGGGAVVPVSKKKNKLTGAAVAAIAVGAGAAALLALVLLVLCAVHHRRTANAEDGKAATPTTRGLTPSTAWGEMGGEFTSSSKEISFAAAAAGGTPERSRLVFVGKLAAVAGQHYSFDLEDLLRASAEVLGKGSLGTSYKATLEEGTTVVVKRLRDVSAARREFAACVEAAAGVEHRNLLPVRGYYYSKDEKLLVCDYLPGGSLSARLHGSRGTGRTPMDWEARMSAALCAARGVAHLHTAHSLAHGNVKSSNLLLRPDQDAAALSDYCLHQVSAAPLAHSSAGAGYRAPELVDARCPTLRSDVYSLGVLFLELLTGKSPSHHASLDGEGVVDLPRWVQSVVREEWTAEVFDAELVRLGGSAEEEMVALLQVAMACVATAPDARPDAADVVRMIEDIGGGHGRTTTEESEGTRGASEEERSRGTAAAGATP